MNKVQLSQKQKEIVFSEACPIYVNASAGSGKTRVLTERVRYSLETSNKKVLALTFTNKAGEEIKERLSDIEDIEKRTFIGTFHSFCQSIIENYGSLIGLSNTPHIFEDENDRLQLIEESINQTPSYAITYSKKSDKDKKNFKYKALTLFAKIKRELIDENNIHEHIEDSDLVLLYRNYQEILKAQNAIDYDDLLLYAANILNNYPKVSALYRRSFSAICVDEAQDLNNAQYQLLRLITKNEFRNIMMVGDPNQAIYHFNGSSSDYMSKYFLKDYDPVKPITLTENFRSSRSVQEAARKIIPGAEHIEGTVKKGEFSLISCSDEYEEAAWIVEKIDDLIKMKTHPDIEGDITYKKIAVLARNKYLFAPLEGILIEEQIPYYYKMTLGPIKFESKLMTIFDLGLKIRLNPSDELHRKRLIKLVRNNKTESKNLLEIVEKTLDKDAQAVLRTALNLHDDGSNIVGLMHELKQKVVLEEVNEKKLFFNDVDEFIKHWHNYAKQTDNKDLQQFKNSMALGKTQPFLDPHGVTLSTVHTMKGQEFDIVFILGLDDETFPDYRALQGDSIELTQERNNLYVAFTRSKRILYATWPASREMPWGERKIRYRSRLLDNFDENDIVL